MGATRKGVQSAVEEALKLGGRPEIAYGEQTTADASIIELVPPLNHYVYLQCLTASVGTEGDQVDLQVLCEDGVFRTIYKPKLLANTSFVKGFPNLKLDRVFIAGTWYAVQKGDGTTVTFRIVARGTGAWEVSLEFYFGK